MEYVKSLKFILTLFVLTYLTFFKPSTFYGQVYEKFSRKKKAFFIILELLFGKIRKNTKSKKSTGFNPFMHTVVKWSRILNTKCLTMCVHFATVCMKGLIM